VPKVEHRRKGPGSARGKPAPARPRTASRAPAAPRGPRRLAPEARRAAILRAALGVFAERGFEAARLDDVAARAGVAKGTLYLYFRDKEALFEALIRTAVSPVMERLAALAGAADLPPMEALAAFLRLFETEVLGTERKLLLRLIIAEGPRFPALAEFYHREVVSRGLAHVRALAARAAASGELPTDAAARFPQLLVAPLLLAVIWDALFGRIAPLDVGGLLRAHQQVLAGKPERKAAP